MRKTIILMSLCAACLMGCSKYYGTPSTRYYPVAGPYARLEISSAFDVTVSDRVTEATVTVGELAHAFVIVEVNNGVMRVGLKPMIGYNAKPTAVIPASPYLCELSLSGASTFRGDMTAETVDVELSGASNYVGNLDCRMANIGLSGSSTASVSGICAESMAIGLSGASTLDATRLYAWNIVGEMSGASTAGVTLSGLLRVDLSGASILSFAPIPEGPDPIVDCSISGASRVMPR